MASSDRDQGKKNISQVQTLTVPFALGEIKENITINTNAPVKSSKEEIINQAFKFHLQGNIKEAAKYYQYFINQGFKDHRVFSYYGNLLNDLGKLKDAELSYRKAIEVKPDFAEAYSNLGCLLNDLGKLKDAELSYRKAIELKPDFAETHSNLGVLLKDLGKYKEAEFSYRKAIEIKPDFAEFHSNLGDLLNDLGKLKDAEFSYQKAIEINPDLAEAHSNLGIILRGLGNLEESELSTRKAIEINPNLAICYQNLSLLFYAKGKINLAVENIEKAFSIDPISKDNQLLRKILKDRKNKKNGEISNHIDFEINKEKYSSYPIILKREVAPELIKELYKLKTIDLNLYPDPSYGNAKGSDYKLFEDNEVTTRELKNDLISITKDIVKSDVFFRDSFFTILGGGGRIKKHNHMGPIDSFLGLSIGKQKYSLVYYLKVGDQNCKNPGILKFYKDKNEAKCNKEILPSEGMIVIFPADRYHSVKYDGNKDRIIVGVNFYSI